MRLREITCRPRGRVHEIARVGRGKRRKCAVDVVAIGAHRDTLSRKAVAALDHDRPSLRRRKRRDVVRVGTDGERGHAHAKRCGSRGQPRLVGARDVMRRVTQGLANQRGQPQLQFRLHSRRRRQRQHLQQPERHVVARHHEPRRGCGHRRGEGVRPLHRRRLVGKEADLRDEAALFRQRIARRQQRNGETGLARSRGMRAVPSHRVAVATSSTEVGVAHRAGVLARHRQAQLVCGERQDVGTFRDLPVRRPIGMTSLRLDADQRRPGTALRRLQRRGELERMARHHAIVVVGGDDERGGVMRARLQVVQRRIAEQVGELIRLPRRAVFGRPRGAAGEAVEAKHVENADGGNRDRVQLGSLRHHGAHQEPAVGAALDHEPGRRRVLLRRSGIRRRR